jgi:hypothetical protein
MDAKNRTSSRLRVESLEDRFLLNSAGSIAPVAPAPIGFDPQVARVSTPFAPVKQAGTGDEGDESPFATPGAVSTVNSHPDPRAPVPDPGASGRYFDSHEREEDRALLLMIAKDEARASTLRDRSGPAPANLSSSPAVVVATAVAVQVRPGVPPRLPEESVVLSVPPNAAGGTTAGVVWVSNAFQQFIGVDSATSIPTGTEPPATGPLAFPDIVMPAIPVDSVPIGWCAVSLNHLADVPVRDAAVLNLSALSAETQAFFEHLADLGAEWSDGVEWSEYVCLAAGTLLVGGVYLARSGEARKTVRRRSGLDPVEGA